MARLLVAEDEEPLRGMIARALSQAGHEVTTAADGAEALQTLMADPDAVDLLLTDIKMPVMDGIALALAAARDAPNVAILLMTGFADQRERASGLQSLVHDIIRKPFSIADLNEAVAEALIAQRQ